MSYMVEITDQARTSVLIFQIRPDNREFDRHGNGEIRTRAGLYCFKSALSSAAPENGLRGSAKSRLPYPENVCAYTCLQTVAGDYFGKLFGIGKAVVDFLA